MINADIPKSIWPEILAAIIKMINKTATRTLSGITPYKTFMDQVEPDKKGQYRPNSRIFASWAVNATCTSQKNRK